MCGNWFMLLKSVKSYSLYKHIYQKHTPINGVNWNIAVYMKKLAML